MDNYWSTSTATYGQLEDKVEDLAPALPAAQSIKPSEVSINHRTHNRKRFSIGRSIAKIAAYSSLFLLPILGSINAQAQNQNVLKQTSSDYIVITGHIHGLPNNNNIPGTVYAMDNTTGDTLDVTVANSVGDYSFYFAWTGIGKKTKDVTEASGKVLGNPATDKATIKFSSPDRRDYEILVKDVLGRKIVDEYVNLNSGVSNVDITGLTPSQYNLVNFRSDNISKTFKVYDNGTDWTRFHSQTINIISVGFLEEKSTSQEMKTIYSKALRT